VGNLKYKNIVTNLTISNLLLRPSKALKRRDGLRRINSTRCFSSKNISLIEQAAPPPDEKENYTGLFDEQALYLGLFLTCSSTLRAYARSVSLFFIGTEDTYPRYLKTLAQ